MRKRITRRQALKTGTIAVGAVAASPVLGKSMEGSINATIILDSGAFLTAANEPYVDVGYFQSVQASDLRVYANGDLILPPPDLKLHRGRLQVTHRGADGHPRSGIVRTGGFERDILRKSELYVGEDVPDFDETKYDCILRFNSGAFYSSLTKPHLFKQVPVGDGEPTGKLKTSRPIAYDVLARYELLPREVLVITTEDGSVLWSSESLPAGTARMELQIIADCPSAYKFYRDALKHTGSHCWVPNPDPPPSAIP